jgi:hypothetical protein
MQLVLCPNSYGINMNHRNNVPTVATNTNDVSNAHSYYSFTDLVPPRSSKLGLRYLKTKARRAVLNLVTSRPHVRLRE